MSSITASALPGEPAKMDPRTRMLLHAPVARTLMRMGLPNTALMLAQSAAGIIETWMIGRLGSDALAGASLVLPLLMLMQMMSAGAVGGGISSSIARALGASRREDAHSIASMSCLIAVVLGAVFMLFFLGAGHLVYAAMGGTGATLEAALEYSRWLFSGAVLIWFYNALASVLRGSGNMALPALVTCVGSLLLVPLSASLVFGLGPFPSLGIAGGAIALLAYYAVGCVVLGWTLVSGRSVVAIKFADVKLQWRHAADILRIGAVSAIGVVALNVCIALGTGFVGAFGARAIAGYGTATRIDYLLVPLVFGMGIPVVTLVGTCLGAGMRERAARVVLVGVGLAAIATGVVGVVAALFGEDWVRLYTSDPDAVRAGAEYLRFVGLAYPFFGGGFMLYFAAQGAGRMTWMVTGTVLRCLVVGAGGWVAVSSGAPMHTVFAVQGAAMVGYGLFNAVGFVRGAWKPV